MWRYRANSCSTGTSTAVKRQLRMMLLRNSQCLYVVCRDVIKYHSSQYSGKKSMLPSFRNYLGDKMNIISLHLASLEVTQKPKFTELPCQAGSNITEQISRRDWSSQAARH